MCLTVPVICLVAGVEVASVSVVDSHSALFGHVSWLTASVANICRMLSFFSFSSLIVVVSFPFSFVVVSFSERVSLSNRLLIVFAFSSFVAAAAPVAPVAFAFVVFSFALLSFAFAVPCCSYVHRCWPLIVAA